MDTMLRNFFQHVLESLKSLRRNGWMTVSSVTAVTVTLTLLGAFLVIILNTVKLAQDMENNVEVSVYVNYETDEDEKKELRNNLEEIPHVESIDFSSKDEELARVQASYGDSWDLFDQDNPLLDVFILRADDPQYVEDITEEANGMTEYVHDASYGEDLSDRIFSIAQRTRTWGLIGSIVLIIVAIFLISNTIRMTILTRKQEIQVMRLVGAKNGYIRWPFFLEGGWIGLIGSIIPIILMYTGYNKVYELVNPILERSNFSLLQPGSFNWQMSLLLAVIGIVIGSVGSAFSMRRFLKF
ncbi:MAG: permease-like cell division protein FtsX [Tetragenococcus halophilus]|uniref:Cell division protein FtsX n=2 Tax=Tetragenococcus halophilus TaxID=51669 RepID=A0AB35HQT2_TETHA|nr:permease-like cell division protein FtsX [Tetragenococcus halophilus]GBD66623.1 cell division protein FtsX [Tetragenococcus halophilus subsp. halophilus]MCO8283675.1 ABC transporter permease [Tetragenococcus halophilus]MCO8298455.1 ABC transporter permease [Tetragenococcus halophilus]MDN6112539.1 permease-like cell division protein FtsX [Tetragenococcus halophilus]MDN6185885.1 permease-like cell division protein FtsX [Tetragenococcus halophilus]